MKTLAVTLTLTLALSAMGLSACDKSARVSAKLTAISIASTTCGHRPFMEQVEQLALWSRTSSTSTRETASSSARSASVNQPLTPSSFASARSAAARDREGGRTGR